MLNVLTLSLGLSSLVANTISVTIGICVSYVLNHFYVFRYPYRISLLKFAQFFAITGFSSLILQNGVIWGFEQLFDTQFGRSLLIFAEPGGREVLALNIAKVVAVGLGLIWNFTMYRVVVFATKGGNTTPSALATGEYTEVDWDRSALVLLDVQNDFVDGAMPVPGTAQTLPQVRRAVEAFRAAGRPVVHVVRLYPPGGSDVDMVRRSLIESGERIAVPGTVGAHLHRSLTSDEELDLPWDDLLAGVVHPLALGPDEAVLYQPRWSAFHRTELADWLAQRKVTSVVVAGANLPNGPRATLYDAAARDLRTALITDAVSQTTPERLADLELIGVNLVGTGEVEDRLAPAPVSA